MVGIGWQAAAGRRGSQRGIPARQEARLGDPQSPTTQYSRHVSFQSMDSMSFKREDLEAKMHNLDTRLTIVLRLSSFIDYDPYK
jgi:hypothetical protein